MKYFLYNVALIILLSTSYSCKNSSSTKIKSDINSEENWISLFNGENLDDWIVKINGYKLHDNHLNTFRVENGTLKVSYDQYDNFTDEFGHLFYKTPFIKLIQIYCIFLISKAIKSNIFLLVLLIIYL